MKTNLRLLAPMVGLVFGLPLVHADQPGKLRVLADAADAQNPDAGTERNRFFRREGGGPREMEKVAFLGVETAPAPAVLAAQLGLPKNAGLVVRHIVPESPAALALQLHDVLLKLDDQLLIESRQFSVLVRNHKAGDEVTLTYVRAGKEATAKVKLTEHEIPKLAFEDGGPEQFDYFIGPDGPGMRHAGISRTLGLLDRAHGEAGPGPHRIAIEGPGFRTLKVDTGNSTMVLTDEKGALELTTKDGQKTLVAKNAKGDQLYAGPIDTPEQRQALPPEVRARLDKIEGMQEFSFHTDDDFQDDVLVPAPKKITLPLPGPRPFVREMPPLVF